MKKYLLLILMILLIPINVFAGVCQPDKISIESITLEESTGSASEKEEASINGNSINLNLHMEEVGDSIDYKIVVKNDSEDNYLLNESDFILESDYIDYSMSTEDDSNIVPAKDKKNVYLRVEYKEEVPLSELLSGTYSANNTMNVVMASNPNEVVPTQSPVITPTPNNTIAPIPTSTQIINNKPIKIPNTFANTSTLFIVLAIGLFGVSLYYYEKSKKVTVALTILGLLVIISSGRSFALCSTSLTIDSNIEIETKISILENRYIDDSHTERDFWLYSESIKTIKFEDSIREIDNYAYRYDVSEEKDGSVIAYLVTNIDDDSKYDLYIMANGPIIANPDSRNLFYKMEYVDEINNLSLLNTSLVTNMQSMFFGTGKNSTIFTLDLGDSFDTSNVTNMQSMFSSTGYSNTSFTLDLGDKFDTSNVTDMSYMFSSTGINSTIFSLDLGDKFDTSNVTNMQSMFSCTGHDSTIFTLDLGEKFDTSNVTNMQSMFIETGYSSTIFTLDLGDKFDTSNVTTMYEMFEATGYSNTSFTLDLGDKFDTSKVGNMSYMFQNFQGTTIYAPSSFITGNGTFSTNMFYKCINLVGGAGTVYTPSHIDKKYARIDNPPDNPGYFTARS